MKKVFIVANWKMNPQRVEEAERIMEGIAEGIGDVKGAEVVICPPFLFLSSLLPYAKGVISLGAQNAFWEKEGAFTGEVSPVMLKNLGCGSLILGHSERKKHLGETLDMVRKKLEAATTAGLRVILCVENASELSQILQGADASIGNSLVVVHEPSWAISSSGKGNAESPSLAKKEISSMKDILKEAFGMEVPVLYGGSVDAANIRSFLSEAGADGALVGYASLDPATFSALVKEASLV